MVNRFVSNVSGLFSSFVDFLYPPLCLHCENSLERGERLFCRGCAQLFELIDPRERCPYCFSPDFCPLKCVCSVCEKQRPAFNRIGAAFDYIGPPATLVKKMKYGGQPYLAKGAAAYLVLQLYTLDWPLPDVIVPAPISFLRRFDRGYNQSLLLAQAFGALIDRPVADILRRSTTGYSQAALSRKQRMELTSGTFKLTEKAVLQDKVVAVIDDVATTGTTLRCCAEALQEQHPASLYGLTLCRTI